MGMDEILLRMEGIELRLGKFELNIPEFILRPGEYFVLVGETGAGKTIFLETILGLVAPSSGRVVFGGRLLDGVPPEERGMGYVPQDYALFPHMDVFGNIAYALRLRDVDEAGIKDLVSQTASKLGIEELLQRDVLTLSGGERQRVALARALVLSPALLLLDEPLGALDESTRSRLAGELRRIQRESGTTFLHVTHDLDEACEVADRIAIMHEGRIVQVDTPEHILCRPRDLWVARFVRCLNMLEGSFAASFSNGDGGADEDAGVKVVLRPEHLVVQAGTEAGAGGCDGHIELGAARVRECRRRLHFYDVSLEYRNGTLHAFTRRPLRPGEHVRLHVARRDVHMLPEAPE